MVEILLISILCLTALVFGGLFLRERRVRRSVEAAPEPAALTEWKRERFEQEEHEWLLQWVACAGTDYNDIRQAWFRRNKVSPLVMTPDQRESLENELVYWARRRVNNKSQYGKGGWDDEDR